MGTGCLTPEHIDYDCVGGVVICSGKEMSDEEECNELNGTECNNNDKCQVSYEVLVTIETMKMVVIIVLLQNAITLKKIKIIEKLEV